jgi:hypothetical protein
MLLVVATQPVLQVNKLKEPQSNIKMEKFPQVEKALQTMTKCKSKTIASRPH